MAAFFADYGLFLLKVLTFVIAIIAVIFTIVFAASRGRGSSQGQIEIKKMNETLEYMQDALKQSLLSPIALKQNLKSQKAQEKEKSKAEKKGAKAAQKQRGKGQTLVVEPRGKKSVYVVDFDGDMRGSAVSSLRHEISAILTTANHDDEVVVRLDSGGGMVTSYGLAASQLDRIRKKDIPLTVCIDKVAASGGYMMACVANKILAAPFAVVGSIGVVAQIPNFHRLLQEHKVDVELLTAGKFKRTLTMFGENTDEGRTKFAEDIEQIHEQFKSYVKEHRSALDIEQVATGEIWSGQAAKDIHLIDQISTSDEYLVNACEDADVYEIKYKIKKSVMEKVGLAVQTTVDNFLLTWYNRLQNSRYLN